MLKLWTRVVVGLQQVVQRVRIVEDAWLLEVPPASVPSLFDASLLEPECKVNHRTPHHTWGSENGELFIGRLPM